MSTHQPGILAPLPREARFIELDLSRGAEARPLLERLAALAATEDLLVGLGLSLVLAARAELPGLRSHPHHVGPGFEVPSTPCALWLRVVGADRGDILMRTRRVLAALGGDVVVERVVDAFVYGDSHDLSGYEDGTENPTGDDATAAALASTGPLAGSSYVAVQQWVHDLDHFETLDETDRDHIIGRRQTDNEELKDAPESAHVKRTAQEDFSPPAFVLRRSMPWTDGARQGLYFVAFGARFDAYEALLQRMVGADDGVPDALFRFTRPISGAFYWCPPLTDGALDLSAVLG